MRHIGQVRRAQGRRQLQPVLVVQADKTADQQRLPLQARRQVREIADGTVDAPAFQRQPDLGGRHGLHFQLQAGRAVLQLDDQGRQQGDFQQIRHRQPHFCLRRCRVESLWLQQLLALLQPLRQRLQQ